ncbi:MAG: D-alanyl-D-alanine dipeptidase [Candidatus Kapabacteria bacterium]|nr:D-alanyl-D-alanine dipeptidase [Candidatus Kapabacteria bacterium]
MRLVFLFVAVFAATTRSMAMASDTILVRLADAVPGLHFDVRYATPNNFTGRTLYSSDTLWARQATAIALRSALELARQRGYGLLVFDAYRPLSVQKLMWSILPDERYVADPSKGSRHNRGAAVDITLCTFDGTPLDMGTPYDDFTEKAHVGAEGLSEAARTHRAILHEIMSQAGFEVLPTEWWHYDVKGWERFSILQE